MTVRGGQMRRPRRVPWSRFVYPVMSADDAHRDTVPDSVAGPDPGQDGQRRGHEQVISDLFDRHRRELHAHCYRMLGSVHDADDALQETVVRAWRGMPAFAGRSSLRTWLFTIATNVCLTIIERRPRPTVPLEPDRPPADLVWIEPYADVTLGPDSGQAAPAARYDRRESVELAFIVATQLLPATQRAVLLLRDVLGFSAHETASALDTSVASVTSALQRARATVRSRLPDRSEQANLRALGDAELRTLVDGYVGAWERGDVPALVAMLADDATFSMPPDDGWYRGRADIAAFLPEPMRRRWRLVPVRASGQLAFACYVWVDDEDAFVAHSVDVLTLQGAAIGRITAFLDATWVRRLGLPARWPGARSDAQISLRRP